MAAAPQPRGTVTVGPTPTPTRRPIEVRDGCVWCANGLVPV